MDNLLASSQAVAKHALDVLVAEVEDMQVNENASANLFDKFLDRKWFNTTDSQCDINLFIIKYPSSAICYFYRNRNINQRQMNAMLLNVNTRDERTDEATRFSLFAHPELTPSLLDLLAGMYDNPGLLDILAHHPNATDETRVLAALRFETLTKG